MSGGHKIIKGLKEAVQVARGKKKPARVRSYLVAGEYRFVGKDRITATRWRPMPRNGVARPSKAAQKLLGAGYSIEIRRASIEWDPIKAAIAGTMLALSGHGAAALKMFRGATSDNGDGAQS